MGQENNKNQEQIIFNLQLNDHVPKRFNAKIFEHQIEHEIKSKQISDTIKSQKKNTKKLDKFGEFTQLNTTKIDLNYRFKFIIGFVENENRMNDQEG